MHRMLRLYGSATAQIYSYLMNYADASKTSQITAWVIWLLDSVHTVLCLFMVYHYIIVDFGNSILSLKISWSFGAAVIMQVLMTAIVQSFYMYNIWILSKARTALKAPVAFLLFLRIALGFATALLILTHGHFSELHSETSAFITVIFNLTIGAFVDAAISALLIYYNILKFPMGHKNKRHFVVDFVHTYLINSGIATLLVSLSVVFTFSFITNSMVFVGLIQIQGKLYVNSCIGILNAQQKEKESVTNIIHRLPAAWSQSGLTNTHDSNTANYISASGESCHYHPSNASLAISSIGNLGGVDNKVKVEGLV